VTPESNPRVSIGLPLFNGEKWIRPTIESVLAQDYRDLELVISDNASTDASAEICREYRQDDARIKYFRNEHNVGVSNNFNLAFERARGEFFKWTSCSDLIDRSFVSRCLPVLESQSDVALVFPRTRLFRAELDDGQDYVERFDLDDHDPVVRFARYTLQAGLNNIMHGLIRSSMLRKTQMYRKFIGADYNMIADLILRGRAVHLPDVLHFRRMDDETFSARYSAIELKRLYEPSRPGKMSFQIWRRAINYVPVALHAPLPWRIRLRLLDFVARRTYWIRPDLVRDLRESAAGCFGLGRNRAA